MPSQVIRIAHAVAAFAVMSQAGAGMAHAQQPLPVSKGVYRLPYTDGTSVTFSNDHTNHPTTLNRVDLNAQGAGPFTVVSAAAGWVRIIVENNDTKCPNACGNNNDCDGNGVTTATENQQAQTQACGGYSGPSTFCCERDFESNGGNCPGAGTCLSTANNFVWMEHQNGEWTKYTHMLRGSVGTGTDVNGNPGAGRVLNEFIGAGTPLGIEGDVGIASGPHVHFEVAVPNHVELPPPPGDDPDAEPDTVNDWFSGGFLVSDGVTDDVDGDGSDDVFRQNRIPVFCQIGIAVTSDNNTSGPCNDVCDAADPDLSGVTIAPGVVFHDQTANTIGNPSGDLVIRAFSGAALRAGSRVTLSPGFHAELNSFFSASTGTCDSPGGTGE